MLRQIFFILKYGIVRFLCAMRVFNTQIQIYYSAPVGVRSIVINLSVCPRAYLWNRWTDRHESLPCGRGSVLLWRRCATLCILLVLWMMSLLAVMGVTPARVASTQRRRSITCATGAESEVYECLLG